MNANGKTRQTNTRRKALFEMAVDISWLGKVTLSRSGLLTVNILVRRWLQRRDGGGDIPGTCNSHCCSRVFFYTCRYVRCDVCFAGTLTLCCSYAPCFSRLARTKKLKVSGMEGAYRALCPSPRKSSILPQHWKPLQAFRGRDRRVPTTEEVRARLVQHRMLACVFFRRWGLGGGEGPVVWLSYDAYKRAVGEGSVRLRQGGKE